MPKLLETPKNGIIYPTEKCFDDAIDFLDTIMRANIHQPEIAEHFRLVHGILATEDEEEYSHAWVEFRTDGTIIVIYSGIYEGEHCYFTMPRKEYYFYFRVRDITLYTIAEMLEENRKYENYGPWITRYRELCKNKGVSHA